MKKFISMFAALILGAVTIFAVNAAPVGNPFLKGVNSPSELAGKIEASLAKDPKGTTMLDAARCKKDGSCARPLDYLMTLQQSDPDARLTDVAQVPVFLRTLRVTDAPTGEYWISCLKPTGKGAYEPVLHCLSRSFKPGEKAWVNPKSGRIVFASDCTNPIEKPVPPKQACAEVRFFTKKDDPQYGTDTAVRFAIVGPADVKDDCIGVKRAGEEDFERWWTDECKNVHCEFAAPAAVVGQRVRLIGSYVPAPGEHVLRVPVSFTQKGSLYRVLICLDRTTMAWPELPKEYRSLEALLATAPRRPVRGDDPVAYLAAYGEWRITYIEWRNSAIAKINDYAKKREQWIVGHSDTIGVRWHDYQPSKSGIKTATVYYDKAEIPSGEPQLYIPWGEWEKMQKVR